MSKSNTNFPFNRREFLQVSSAAVAGLAATPLFAAPSNETLALSGGPKAVTVPEGQQRKLFHWPRYGDAEKKAVSQLLGMDLGTGGIYQPLKDFEQDWKAFINVPFVKNYFNGTSALAALYFALDFPAGSEVLVPTQTFFATIVPMRLFGYVPVFVDSNPNTRCFDLADAKHKLTPNTRAMVPMHPGGMPCDMDEINDFAKEKGLIVIEDAAHAHGATLKGKRMGAWGDSAIFSFQASKPLPCLEGGMGVYQRREVYERATAFGHYDAAPSFPKDSPYRYPETGLGLKLRMHPVAAVLGREQLRGLDQRNADIRRRVRQLNDRVLQLPGLSEARCRPDAVRVYYEQNLLHLDEAKAGFSREAMLRALNAEGVRAKAGQYIQQHRHRIYSEAKWWHHAPVIPKGDLPGCAQLNRTSFHMPIFHEDAPEIIEQYATAFEKVWARKKELATL